MRIAGIGVTAVDVWRRRLVLVLAVAAVSSLLPVSAALAKSPPSGTYECTTEGLLFGDLKITGPDTYKRNGKNGTYKAGERKITFQDGLKGYKLKFKGGSFDGFKGRWYKVDSGAIEIALESPLDGFENIYCDN